MDPEQRKYAVVVAVDPDTGGPAFFITAGHSFGLVSAVYNYNRRSALVDEILEKIFMVPANFFYDDKFGFELEETADQAADIVSKVHQMLGADFSAKKLQLTSTR